MRNSSNFSTYSFADLLPWVWWCQLSMRRALNNSDTYFVSSSSFILSHVSSGDRPRAAHLFCSVVQYWLAWPDSFIAAYLTFLDSVSSYHVKYLSSWSVQSMKSYGSRRPSKLGTSILMLFRYWVSGLDRLSVLLRRLFLGRVWPPVASTLVSLSSSVLRASSLAFILVNIAAIYWGSTGKVWDLLNSPIKYGWPLRVGMHYTKSK